MAAVREVEERLRWLRLREAWTGRDDDMQVEEIDILATEDELHYGVGEQCGEDMEKDGMGDIQLQEDGGGEDAVYRGLWELGGDGVVELNDRSGPPLKVRWAIMVVCLLFDDAEKRLRCWQRVRRGLRVAVTGWSSNPSPLTEDDGPCCLVLMLKPDRVRIRGEHERTKVVWTAMVDMGCETEVGAEAGTVGVLEEARAMYCEAVEEERVTEWLRERQTLLGECKKFEVRPKKVWY